MRYVAFVGTEGRNQPEIVEEMNRDWPAYEAELHRRVPWRAGRELELPDQGVKVVTVRGGETFFTDGPFAVTKEYIAGLDVFECADLSEAIELEGKSPVARFLPFEIRELPEAFVVGSRFREFADCDDARGAPFLLITWSDAAAADGAVPSALAGEYAAWQRDVDERGTFIFGGVLPGAASAVTLRPVDKQVTTTQGSFIAAAADVIAIDVVRAEDWDEVMSLASTHPLALRHAIELRRFHITEP